MQKTIKYPAIFRKCEDQITVDVPDIYGCYTYGGTIDEAAKMAEDAIEEMLIPDFVAVRLNPDLIHGSLDVRYFIAEIQINVREAEG